MANVKAKTSFAGVVTMGAGEVRNIEDKTVLDDLLAAGYVELVEKQKATTAKTKKKGDSNEN